MTQKPLFQTITEKPVRKKDSYLRNCKRCKKTFNTPYKRGKICPNCYARNNGRWGKHFKKQKDTIRGKNK